MTDALKTSPAAKAVDALQERVGQRVRNARETKGIPRRILSETSGVSQRYLAQLESGSGNISIALLYRVAEALDLSLESLVSDTELTLKSEPKIGELYENASEDIQAKVMQLLSPPHVQKARAKRVCLIGLRGAGKTTLGQKVSHRLDIPFVELNTVIEELGGMAISEVMEFYGQEGYRRLEAQALQHIIDTRESLILAVAGGIVAEPETYATLLNHFHTVWVRTTPEEHMTRVRAQGDTRPMAGNPEAMEQLKRILSAREGEYARASAQLDTSDQRPGVSTDQLITLIRENGFIGQD